MDKKYEEICNKMGCEPKDIKIPYSHTEDDTWVSPFSVLTIEEMDYLYDNGYLDNV